MTQQTVSVTHAPCKVLMIVQKFTWYARPSCEVGAVTIPSTERTEGDGDIANTEPDLHNRSKCWVRNSRLLLQFCFDT